MPSSARLVKVEIIDPVLRARNGTHMHVGRERAMLGVRAGKWKIVEGYEDREMRIMGGSGDYLMRAGFSQPPVEERGKDSALSFADMFGEKKKG